MNPHLLETAEELCIDITYKKIKIAKSLVIRDQDELTININEKAIETDSEKNVFLAHELGHCISGSLYTINHSKLYRGSAEYRADYRAAQLIMPIDKLKECINIGITENYALAEHFNITEEFVKRALYIYGNKGLLEGIR